MFSVMTWNLENFERPAANAEQAVKERYARKLQQISELIISAGPDLVGVQEVLADHKNLAPQVFDDLREALGPEWNGCLSQRPDPRGIRVGWLARGQLSDPTDVAVYPPRVPATTIDDDGSLMTAITAAKRGALAVTYTRADGLSPRQANGVIMRRRHTESLGDRRSGPRPRADAGDDANTGAAQRGAHPLSGAAAGPPHSPSHRGSAAPRVQLGL
jgi:hypothetical protein